MTTAVDIDKLKDLLAGQLEVAAELQNLEGYLAMLIAKAERVDALERALERAADALEAARDAFEETWVGTGDPEDHAAKVIADIELTAARNALSPKESE